MACTCKKLGDLFRSPKRCDFKQVGKFFKNGSNPTSICSFSFFSIEKCSTNYTVNDKSIDGVLGTQTQGVKMVGADKSTELWRYPRPQVGSLPNVVGNRGAWIADWYHIRLWSLVHFAMPWAMSSSLGDNKLFFGPKHNIYAFLMILFGLFDLILIFVCQFFHVKCETKDRK